MCIKEEQRWGLPIYVVKKRRPHKGRNGGLVGKKGTRSNYGQIFHLSGSFLQIDKKDLRHENGPLQLCGITKRREGQEGE